MTTIRTGALVLIALLVLGASGCSQRQTNSKSLDEQLLQAAEKSDLPSVVRLLKKGAHVDAKDSSGWTSLTFAAGRGDTVMAKLLLDKGASYEPCNFDRESPWSFAVRSGRVSIVELFLQKGIDEESRNQALFHAIRDQPVIIEIKAADDQASHSADLDPFAQIVKLLLESGAQVNTRDEEGETPLMVAAAYGRFATVKVLLDKGADVEATDKYGNTALLAAACDCALATMPDTYDAVKLLLESGAKINATNKEGDTPLMIASGGGVVKTQIVDLLLQKGADLRLKNARGQTAPTIARKDDVRDVVRLLQNASAKRH